MQRHPKLEETGEVELINTYTPLKCPYLSVFYNSSSMWSSASLSRSSRLSWASAHFSNASLFHEHPWLPSGARTVFTSPL